MSENQFWCTFNVVLTQFGPFIPFLRLTNDNAAYVDANESISTSNEAWHCRNLIDLSLSPGLSSLRWCLQDNYTPPASEFFWNALGWRINSIRFRSCELLCADLKVYQNSKWAKGLLSTTVTPESKVSGNNAWVCRNRLVVIHRPITCLHPVGIFFTHFLKNFTCPTTIKVIIIIICIIIITSSDLILLTAHHWSWTCRQSLLLSTDTKGQYQLRHHMKHPKL